MTIDPSPIAALIAAGRRARETCDWRGMIAAGDALERAGAYADAWPLLADAAVLKSPGGHTRWAGERLAGKTLLVRKRIRHVGAELRMARFLAPAIAAGADVLVSGDPRLDPLLARTFGVGTGGGDGRAIDFETSYEGLAAAFGAVAEEIARLFRPLTPDPGRTERFRRSYGVTGGKIIGIAWYSENRRKDLPRPEQWSSTLRNDGVSWCSLQYREVEAGLGDLIALSGRPVAPTSGLDQMRDLDGFAAQVAAMDGVLTISNTTAHMAGALGIPCAVLVDDGDHLSWPATGDRSPFYPSVRIVRRAGADWADVIARGFGWLLASVG